MTKAQEVRKRRLEAIQSDITAHAEKVFDWMLDLIDADTKKGYYRSSIEVCLFDDQDTIKTTDFSGKKATEYNLSHVILKRDRLALFSTLKKVVEKEEGFKAVFNPDATLYDSKCIVFQIIIE